MFDIEQVIKKHYHTALRMAFRILRNREDAEDAVQQSCMNAFRFMDGFQSRSAPGTWFLAIVHNQALMVKREIERNRCIVTIDTIEAERLLIHHHTPERYAIQEEKFRLIDEFVDNLPHLLRNSMRQRIRTDAYPKSGKIKTRLHRARVRLYKKIDKAKLQELYKVA